MLEISSVEDCLKLGTLLLEKITDVPNLEAEILLAYTLKCDRAYLFRENKKFIEPKFNQLFLDLIHRRIKGEPIAYILGEKEFYSRQFKVDSNVLIPRPETELLVETILELKETDKQIIADLGTGSGVIAVTIAIERPNWEVWATDIDSKALCVAQYNAQLYQASNIVFIQCNWMSALPINYFDIIICNPPYLSQDDKHLKEGDLRFEPTRALVGGKIGLEAIDDLFKQVTFALRVGGWFLLEYGWDQGEKVRSRFHQWGFGNIKSKCDLSGIDRISFGQKLS